MDPRSTKASKIAKYQLRGPRSVESQNTQYSPEIRPDSNSPSHIQIRTESNNTFPLPKVLFRCFTSFFCSLSIFCLQNISLRYNTPITNSQRWGGGRIFLRHIVIHCIHWPCNLRIYKQNKSSREGPAFPRDGIRSPLRIYGIPLTGQNKPILGRRADSADNLIVDSTRWYSSPGSSAGILSGHNMLHYISRFEEFLYDRSLSRGPPEMNYLSQASMKLYRPRPSISAYTISCHIIKGIVQAPLLRSIRFTFLRSRPS